MFCRSRASRHLGPGRAHQRAADGRAAHGRAVLFDVRETAEWEAGHAPDAPHPPLSRLVAGEALPPAAQGGPVVAIRRSGRRSRQAVEILTGRGTKATDVTSGMVARARAGLPVARPDGDDGAIA
ncbi:rhodanese-like domain-containing protein [Streptomyces sp. NPDC088253]|uniref:rhodanese-like domain-containing protein n=1 Tax=Streptomyces sp. NPDC088253 TaxID=3365846 RepID=UPI0038203A15